jgi:regulatory protein
LAARAQGERSLKSRALQLLAQRDQSRLELKRKLLRHVRRAALAAAAADESGQLEAPAEDEAEVEVLLDWLEANRFLCNERFVDSRVHAREARFGNLRIRSELAQHGVALAPERAQALGDSELARAAAVRERRFALAPCDAVERARQCRFLAGRGFSPEVIRRLMRQLREPSAQDPPAPHRSR